MPTMLLSGLRVLQLGPGTAAAVCGRLLADMGADVACSAAAATTPFGAWLDHGKTLGSARLANNGQSSDALATADLIVVEGGPAALRARGHDAASLRARYPHATLVLISPYGQTGPQADDPATDLTLMAASGIARMLTGQVDDLSEPPVRAVGGQSAILGGLAAACAGMHAVLAGAPAVIDVSMQEALATLAMTELARVGQTGQGWRRTREADGNGATVCILPARDGYAAISPREERQWRAWLVAMGSPAWGDDPRFARKPDRVANWDALHALMAGWSRDRTRHEIAACAQAAHVPSFPLQEPAEQFASAHLAHRGFWRRLEIGGRSWQVPGPPFGLQLTQARPVAAGGGALPLAGVRVLDFSWVIAGPTATRTLAAMGAEVIKVEAPGAGDPGRASGLHAVLGQAKRGIVLDLKRPEGVATAQALAERCDVLVENFASGVMDRLGLGVAALRARNPELIYVSASGLGRTGPEAQAVAYGTLLQCYVGFAGLNRHPDRPPRVGMAWLDPMCGLMLAFVTAASLWQRGRRGMVARVDFSMVEAMLWTMAAPLLAAQGGGTAAQADSPEQLHDDMPVQSPPRDTPTQPQPRGNASDRYAPHGVYRCAGDDAWLSLAARDDADWRALCGLIPALAPLAGYDVAQRRDEAETIDHGVAAWCRTRSAPEAAALLLRAGVPAAALADSHALASSPHLRLRGFWEEAGSGVLPGLPWRASFGRTSAPAPGLGADTAAVLAEVIGLSAQAIDQLRGSGALG